ncbi:MAG: YgjV family protein [Clostridia bacterium]|nr:YgjV family protein [Clostridia bacterium]
MDVIAQILSIISCAGIIFSFQLKNNRHLFLVQTISAVCFGISYLLLGAYDGFLINVIAFTNTFVLLNKKLKKPPILTAICIGYIVVPLISLLCFEKVWTTTLVITTIISFVIAISQIAYTIAMWKNNGKAIRTVRLFAVTPAWLAYNITVFSLGGIICESFNIISIIISFIGYGKDGFEK